MADDNYKDIIDERRRAIEMTASQDQEEWTGAKPANGYQMLLFAWNYGLDVSGQKHRTTAELSEIQEWFRARGIIDPLAPDANYRLRPLMPSSWSALGVNPQLWVYSVMVDKDYKPSLRATADGTIDPLEITNSQDWPGARALVASSDQTSQLAGLVVLQRIEAAIRKTMPTASLPFNVGDHDQALYQDVLSFGSLQGYFDEYQRRVAASAGTPNGGASGGGVG